MKEFDQKKTDLQKSLKLNAFSFKANRMVYDEGAPKEGSEGGKEAPKPTIDVNSPDFDNLAFKEEKRGEFKDNLDSAIRNTIMQVPELKDKTPQIDQLQNEFTTGLKESVLLNKGDIAEAIKTISPKLYAEKDGLNKDSVGLWFQNVLINLKCNRVGLLYDITDDTTKFKFYGEKGEIKFKSSDIKIQYVPAALKGTAEVVADAVEQPTSFTIGKVKKEDLNTKNYSVDHVKLIKKYVPGHELADGERVVVKRGTVEIKGRFDAKKQLFISEDKQQVWFIGGDGKYPGDKVTFYPNTKEKPGAKNTVELGDKTYVILRQIDTKSTYLDVANAILNYTSGKGAVVDGVQILDDETCASIVRSNITAPEYAGLLKAAHEKLGKNNRLPIIMPQGNLERKYARKAKVDTANAEAFNAKAQELATADLTAQLKAGLDVAKRHLNPEQQKEVDALLAEYQQKMAKEPDATKQQEIIQDLLDSLDNYFVEAGFQRNISKKLETVMDAGRDGDAWKELWTKENPTVKKVMTIIEANPDVFGKVNKNAVRGKVYDLIRASNSSSFNSGDIIAAFGIKLPVTSQEYDEVLGLAAVPTAALMPALKEKQDKCRRYVSAIEGLSIALQNLDPGQTKSESAAVRGHEKLADNAEGGAKNLKKLVDLLNVSSSTPITKVRDGVWNCTIEKGGKKLTLSLQEQGTGQYIAAYDAETGNKIWSEWDNFGFDAPDYVDKINSLLSTQSKTKTGEKAGEKLEGVNIGPGGTFYSLRGLESLSQSVPGVPVKELLEVPKEKGAKLIDNKLGLKTKDVLHALDVMGTAKFVDTPENLTKLKDNSDALINLRYKGKDFTLHINNAAVGWGVRMAPGFNNDKAKDGDTAYTTAGGMDVPSVVQGIDNVIGQKGYTNTERMAVSGNVDRVSIFQSVHEDFNKAVDAYIKASGYKYDLKLNTNQLMEVIFRAYSFDSLKEMGCIKKVNGQEKAYIIAKLPEKFKTFGSHEGLRNLIYAVKYGNVSGYEQVKSGAGEVALESENAQAKYENRLKKLFAVGLTDFDEKGKKVKMSDVDSGSVTDYSKDEYFKKVSGDAAYNDFYDQVRTRNEKGVEVIDINKTNTRLTELFQKGLVKLNTLAKTNTYYGEMNKQVPQFFREGKTINLDMGLSDLEQKIIRLGYLQDIEQKEQNQAKSMEGFKAKLVENILKLLPEKIEDPNNPGHFITREQAAATLKDLPIGILLSYSRNSAAEGAPEFGEGGKNTLGIYVPIILDVFNSPYAKLVLLPGANTSDGLKFAIGVSFTSKDPNNKDQRVIFMGGVSVGFGTTFTGASFGAAIGGGVDFKITKADEVDNYNHYLGIRAGAGFDITKVAGGAMPGFELGLAYTWEIDAQQKYTNTLKEYFTKEGIQGYIDQLKDIYKKGSDPVAIDKFCVSLKADKAMAEKIGLKGTETNEEILMAFEQYVAASMEKFNEDFDLPTILGGQVSIGVVNGSIIAIGAATGNIPAVIGGVVIWGIQFLASLKFNVGSRMVIERQQKTTEKEMGAFGDLEKQKQFDSAFESLPKSAAASKLYLSGRNTLDAKGQKQTSMGVETKSSEAEVPAENLGKKIDEFNKTLAAKGIDMKLEKGADNRIELVLLDSKVAANEKILISPDLAVTEGNRIFLKNPNNLSFLFFNKQTRKYPLETSHGASIETVITISDNRFYKGDTFPTEVSLTRFADAKDAPIVESKATGKAEAYVDNSVDYSGIAESRGKMKKALDKSTGIEAEPVRKNIKALATKISQYVSKKKETFLSITSEKSKENLTNPNYLSEKLYSFYDDFAKDKELDGFNASEKAILTLELSTLRYTNLMAGAPSAIERARRFRDRLNWAKETIRPYFEKRLTDLTTSGKLTLKPGETVAQRAKILVDKAIGDLQYLDTTMPATKLREGTSVAVAIGVGGRGLHQMLDGTRDKLQTTDVDEYGYIMGKDYTEAMRTGQPVDDHDIALILMGQLSALPKNPETDPKAFKEFMDSNLARKLASNGGLAFILGKEDYAKVVEFYNSGAGDAAGLSKFIDIVKKIRAAEESGQELISVKGDKGVNFLIKVNPQIQSGVFQKCGNYSAAINEDIAIIPPSQEEAMVLMASGSEARTTLTTKAYKQFLGFFGGVTASVALEQPKGDGGGGKPDKPDAPAKGDVEQAPGGPVLPPKGPGTPSKTDTPTAPGDTDV